MLPHKTLVREGTGIVIGVKFVAKALSVQLIPLRYLAKVCLAMVVELHKTIPTHYPGSPDVQPLHTRAAHTRSTSRLHIVFWVDVWTRSIPRLARLCPTSSATASHRISAVRLLAKCYLAMAVTMNRL